MRVRKLSSMVLAVALVASAVAVQAKITIDMVPVGNAGNNVRNAPTSIRGSVSYNYEIAKYETTAGQYCAFLNAVGGTDTYGLYNVYMSNTSYGSGIARAGISGNYSYTVAANFVNRPVNYVSFGDAMRFTNWLQNGQPTGAQSLATTESGTYNLSGGTTAAQLMAVAVPDATQRATWATTSSAHWLLPSEDEWHKSAYYDPNKAGGAGYWTYPTKSDAKPGRNLADVSGNNANSYEGIGSYPIDSGKYTTLVGEFQNSASAYGTFDQGGNVWEWIEAVDTDWFGSGRGLLGGSFYDSTMYQDRTLRVFGRSPTDEYYGNWLNGIGFRVASVPEPSTLALLGTALLGLGVICLRRRRAKA